MTSGTETVRVLVAHNREDGRVEPGEEIVVSNKEARELETMGWGINVEKADLGDLAAANLIELNAEEQAFAQEEAEAQEQAQEDQKERVLGSGDSASSSHYTGSVDPQGRVQSVEDSKYEASDAAKEDEPKAKSSSASKSKSKSKE